MADAVLPESFAYQAHSVEGQSFAGTIDARGIDDAAKQLQLLKLQVNRLEPASATGTGSGAPARSFLGAGDFKAADFLAFNQQLPIERSLGLMAAEVTNPRQAQALRSIANELEKGAPLAMAFATQKLSFPPLYAKLLDAGVRSNNLPAMLLNLGRHVQLMQRLRAAWWRSAAYPLTVLASLLVVMLIIWTYILPRFLPLCYGPIFQKSSWGRYSYPSGEMGIDPSVKFFLALANVVGYSVITFISVVLATVLVLWILSRMNAGRAVVEKVVLPLPLVGPILKWSMVARWCDALQLGVQAGMPLPAALELARDAVVSENLHADTQGLIATVNSGASLERDSITHFLPPLIPASLQMGIEKNDLPAAVAMLTQMYEEQTEIRLALLPRVVSPILLIVTATCLGLAVAAMLLPLVAMIRALTGN